MMHCRYFDTLRKGNHSPTLIPTVVSGRRPLPFEIFAESGPPPFEKRRLRQISSYKVSTVTYSEESSIMTNIKSTTGFPTSHRWSAYVTPKSRKGGSKRDFFYFFVINVNFNRIKSATKFLCLKTSSGKIVVRPFHYLTVHTC